MKLSMTLDYAEDHAKAARPVVDLERAGLDIVWVAEAYSFDAPSFIASWPPRYPPNSSMRRRCVGRRVASKSRSLPWQKPASPTSTSPPLVGTQ